MTIRQCRYCGATADGRAEPICNRDGLVGPHSWEDVGHIDLYDSKTWRRNERANQNAETFKRMVNDD